MVSLHVGLSEGRTKTFPVYRGLLSWHSPYFNTLLNGPFREGGADEISIDDISADDFEATHFWLNTRRLYDETKAEVLLTFSTIIAIYIFADAHIMPRLKNAAVEAMAEKVTSEYQRPSPLEVVHLYEMTAGDCAMRALLARIEIDIHNWKPDRAKYFCKDLMFDIMKIICEGSGEYDVFTKRIYDGWYFEDFQNTICDFHDHSEP